MLRLLKSFEGPFLIGNGALIISLTMQGVSSFVGELISAPCSAMHDPNDFLQSDRFQKFGNFVCVLLL